jgi:hypothetical protein
MEEMSVDDGVADGMTHSQSQETPKTMGGLLGVSTANGTEPLQRPASAPPVFPHSDRHDTEEEASVIIATTNLGGDRAGYVCLIHLIFVPRARLSSLPTRVWRLGCRPCATSKPQPCAHFMSWTLIYSAFRVPHSPH